MMIDCIVKSTVARVCRIARTLTNVSKHPPSELHWLENISIYDPLPNQIVKIKQESRGPLKKLAKPWTFLLFLFLLIFYPTNLHFFQFFEIIKFPYRSELPQNKRLIFILSHKLEL